jgi:hypothetical protein
MPRSLTVLLACGILLLSSLALASSASAATIGPTTTCNNNVGNGGATCDVTVVNRITGTGGSATVTVIECTGSAGVPRTSCTTTTRNLSTPVTHVTQCNDSVNGGGGQLLCTVTVTNNFVGINPTRPAVTVNQCNGSGESGAIGSTIVCDPFPATTSGAVITQCNGTGNGGTLVGLICTATGKQPTGYGVTINQCNGSTNGGGTRTVCSASIRNNHIAAAPAPTAGSTTGPRATPPATDTIASPPDQPGSGPLQLALLILSFVASVVLVATLRTGRPTRDG